MASALHPPPNPPARGAAAESGRRAWRLLFFAAGALLLFVALANCGQAFFYPLELESREGGSWLYVMTARAGISLYDHRQVAFLNMNHGPLEPLLKYAVATLLPGLSPAMVTRFFVPLLPLGLVVALTAASGGRKAAGVLWGLGLYLFLLGLQPLGFLVGRSDPAALFLLAGLLAIAAGPLARALVAGRRRLPWIAAAGGVAAMVLLTNWRFGPAVGAVVAAFAIEYGCALPRGRRAPVLGLYLGGLTLVGVAVFLLVLGTIFHGDLALYYRHFFGFFSAASGWGAKTKGTFELLPGALVAGHWLTHLLAAGLVALGVAFPSNQVPRKVQLLGWLPLLALLWLATCVAYYLNRSGGGIWYFGACYVLLAFHLARAVGWEKITFPWARELAGLALLGSLPWLATAQQASRFTNAFAPAYAFRQAAHTLAGAEPIHSEDRYFLQDHYQGEVVDMGDVVFQVSATGYYGPELTATADRYFARLQAAPPRFVLAGECASPVLNALLARRYQPVLYISPELSGAIGPAETFYELKAAPPADAKN